jgi:uncharacterized protein
MAGSKLALVTGASSGIGYELARLFALDGYDLVVAADEKRIREAADELSGLGVDVQPVEVELARAEEVDRLYDAAVSGGRRLDAAALNAGTARAGRFVDGELDADLKIVDVNVRSTVQLAKRVLRDMSERNAGRVLFTSSVVSMMPGSHQSMYNASKSFVQSFAEALHDEFRGTGVSVTALMPGVTDTDFFRRTGLLDTPLGRLPFKDDPAKTARQGYDAMMRGEQKVVASSLVSKLMGVTGRLLPDSVKAVANRLIVDPRDNR